MSEDASSRLCLSCALCCNGSLHTGTRIKPEEVSHLESLGVSITSVNGKLRMLQPCTLLDGTKCRTYAQRPRTCQRYRCTLLRRLEAGEVTLDAALAAVADTRRQQAEGLIAQAEAILARRAAATNAPSS